MFVGILAVAVVSVVTIFLSVRSRGRRGPGDNADQSRGSLPSGDKGGDETSHNEATPNNIGVEPSKSYPQQTGEPSELHPLLKEQPKCWENPLVQNFNKARPRPTLAVFSSIPHAR